MVSSFDKVFVLAITSVAVALVLPVFISRGNKCFRHDIKKERNGDTELCKRSHERKRLV